MKKILALLLATAMFAACNNDNGKKTNEGGGGLFGGNNGGGGTGGGGNGGGTKWASQDENKFMSECNTGMGGMTPNAGQICSCILEKMKNQYSSLDEANRVGGTAAGEKAARECMQGMQGGDGPTPINPNPPPYNPQDEPGDQGTGWTMQQKQVFLGQCVPSAQQAQGLNTQQATAYCECMTNKVAAKFSYAQANRLTAEEFQKPEWQQAMMDCRGNGGY